jgi:cellulose synthase/poly-beta-1,6-N-acetylglucosamine synthase-like glycosyltransferase
MLLDAGTVPAPRACLRLLGTMLADERVGGCCGEIAVAHEQRSLLAPVVM